MMIRTATARFMARAALGAMIPLLALSTAAQAEKTFKWVDQDGSIVYTDRPPPPGMRILDAYGEEAKVDPRQAALAKAVADNPIVLYSVPGCDACDLVRNLLEKTSLPFTEKNAEGDIAVQSELKDKAGQLAVPVLMIGAKVITGYSGSIIRNELTGAGYDLDAPPPAAGAPLAAPETEPEGPLSADQTQNEAAEAAAELLADSDEPLADLDLDPDSIEELEEIPEDERVVVPGQGR